MFPILPLKISNVSTNSIGTDFILPRASEKTNYCKKYFDSYLLFRALVRKIKGYIGSFTVKVIPYDTTIDQTKWDRIRRRRFIDVINMLYDVNLRKK